MQPRRTTPFNDGWRFRRGDVEGGQRPAFDDRDWAKVHLPHDWSIEDLPGAPKTTGDWTPPSALWTAERAPREPGDFTTNFAVPPLDGAPLEVGPFDPVASGPMPLLRGYTVGGVGWYRKTFVAPRLAAGERAELRFEGAYSASEVWLNGVMLGTTSTVSARSRST
ncbi:MAG TPA: hypothetical protein VF210_00655 [Pseudomonadales bacterium]